METESQILSCRLPAAGTGTDCDSDFQIQTVRKYFHCWAFCFFCCLHCVSPQYNCMLYDFYNGQKSLLPPACQYISENKIGAREGGGGDDDCFCFIIELSERGKKCSQLSFSFQLLIRTADSSFLRLKHLSQHPVLFLLHTHRQTVTSLTSTA